MHMPNQSVDIAPMVEGYSAHPFYPVDVELDGYLANQRSAFHMVCMFLVAAVAVLCLTSALILRSFSGLRRSDKLAVEWFVLSKMTSFQCLQSCLDV